MNERDATEIAYKNGFADGIKSATQHGHWIWTKDHWECSACRGPRYHDLALTLDASFCGRCGAKMDINKSLG